MAKFSDLVYAATKKIPRGKVSTYKEIANFLGNPHAARAVGNALHKNPTPIIIPCHRVVNSKGTLAPNFGFGGPSHQKQLLQSEGVKIPNNTVDLTKCLYKLK